MLRAPIKQTVVHFEGQTAKNDDYYEDVTTSSDFWLVFADRLRGYFDEVEVWYQEDKDHPEGAFTHSTGLVERYKRKGFEPLDESPDVLFVRGDMEDYYPVISAFPFAQRIYYPSGPYHVPNCEFNWDVCFVEDARQLRMVHEKTGADTYLFKKSCVDKYFLHWNVPKKYDICVVGGGAEYERKKVYLLWKVMKYLPEGTTALIIGLKSAKMRDDFRERRFVKGVHFAGFVNRKEIGKYMNQCKVGLVLSNADRDGSPRVIQEYLASNIPVVLTENAVFSRYYINEKTGKMARMINSISKAVEKVLGNLDKYSPREYFRENLTMDQSVENFVECTKWKKRRTS